MSEYENQSGHILLSKVQYFVILSVCILTAETATRAKLSLVDTTPVIFISFENVPLAEFFLLYSCLSVSRAKKKIA